MTYQDSQSHIRSFYGLDVKRGTRVVFDGKPGVVTGFRDQYVLVRLDEDQFRKYPRLCHPTWRMAYPDLGREAMTE